MVVIICRYLLSIVVHEREITCLIYNLYTWKWQFCALHVELTLILFCFNIDTFCKSETHNIQYMYILLYTQIYKYIYRIYIYCFWYQILVCAGFKNKSGMQGSQILSCWYPWQHVYILFILQSFIISKYHEMCW